MPSNVTIVDQDGNPLRVDPTHGAIRTSTRPLEHNQSGRVMGHYSLGAPTGALNATLAALSPVFSMRWADTSSFMVLERILISTSGISVAATSPIDFEAINARAFTASDTAGTSLIPSGNSQKNRANNMGTSIMAGAMISSAGTGLTAGTRTLDAFAFASAGFPGSVGGSASIELYSMNANMKHPIVYSYNEGFVIRNITLFAAVTGLKLYVTVDWAEVDEL